MTRERTPLLDEAPTPTDKSHTPTYSTDVLMGNHVVPSEELTLLDEEGLCESTFDPSLPLTTSVTNEIHYLIRNASPIILTLLLQYSIQLATIFSVGHINKQALAGVTLGHMTSSITGVAFIHGLASCLDTMCSQAYGAGKYELVGLQFIRCCMVTLTCFIPIAIVWIFYTGNILSLLIDDQKVIAIAQRYCQIICIGIPGYILFECGKRFLQCQGVFKAGTYVLLVCAPLNALLNYLFVWRFGFGVQGAPMAVVINYWLMPLGVFIYVMFNKHLLKCWPANLTPIQVFEGWDKMLKLGLHGVVMVEAEFVGFELITMLSSKLGTTELAANSILASLLSIAFQVPFAVSMASATRVANFVGAALPINAQTSCRAAVFIALGIGCFNSFMMVFFRYAIAHFYTSDPDVIAKFMEAIPVFAFIGFADALNECSAGGIKGCGLQSLGSRIVFFSFYAVGVPSGYVLCFHFGLGLAGLWWGILIALGLIASLQIYTMFIGCDWEKRVQEAKNRNAD